MKKSIIIGIASLMLQSAIGFSQTFLTKTYTNPVIPGDHSDCTLTQVGNDFYTTGSSFNPTPVIYHSTDLVHWEAIAQPVSASWSEYGDRPSGGCWGGQLVYYAHQYWDFFSHNGSMWLVTAEKPSGPWNMPVKVKNPPELPYSLGYDNSIFIDDNGKWYMIVKNGQPNNGIVELGNDGQPTGVVYDLNWLNTPNNHFPYSWAEGPVMWKENGYYYYSFARDVSGGQKVMRSKTLTADKAAWTTPVNLFNENDPDRPEAIFSSPNHASAVVKLKDGTSWLLHPVWARANNNEWFGQGRQGLLNQVHYDVNNDVLADYPINTTKVAPDLPSGGIPWMVPKSDSFKDNKLNPEWSFLGYTPAESFSLTERPGWLRLSPKNETKPNTIIKTDPEHNYSLITRLDFNAKEISDEAGIRLINGAENLYIKLYSSVNKQGNKVICFSFDQTYYESINNIGNTLWLKLIRQNHIMTGFYSTDGTNWKQVGEPVDIAKLDGYNINYNGWCGNRQGLFVQGKPAYFDLYVYRDAYSPILAECPANQSGTETTKLSDGNSALDGLHNGDWALYAGVEFGSEDYPKASKSIELTASCITKGGTVEVWLDSINGGKKIATCKIKNTGSLSTFKKFITSTVKTVGRHDVYLKFSGKGSDKLFLLKEFTFK